MMAKIGKMLHNFPGTRVVTVGELEDRVEAVEAQLDGVIARVEHLERHEDERRRQSERHDRQ